MDLNILIHIGNILYLISYLVKDIFMLRFILLIAMFIFLPYYFFHAEEPAWPPLIWSFVFISVNLYQLYTLFLERRPVVLNEEDIAIHEQSFSQFSIKQFERLLKIADKKEYNPKEAIFQKGDQPDKIVFTIKGDVVGKADQKVLDKVTPGGFVAYMDYIAESPVHAAYMPETPTKTISWDRAEFEKLINSDPEFKANWQSLISNKLVEQIKTLQG